jgi:hypothetical protein
MLGEFRRSPHVNTSRLGAFAAFAGAGADQLTLGPRQGVLAWGAWLLHRGKALKRLKTVRRRSFRCTPERGEQNGDRAKGIAITYCFKMTFWLELAEGCPPISSITY